MVSFDIVIPVEQTSLLQKKSADEMIKVELVPLKRLHAHEQILTYKVSEIEHLTRQWGLYKKPLLVDRYSGTILDGHHRFEVAKKLNLKCIPCVLIDYVNDSSIGVDIWPYCGRNSITKQQVVKAALTGKLFPPKTSRHQTSDGLPSISIPLSRLEEPAQESLFSRFLNYIDFNSSHNTLKNTRV